MITLYAAGQGFGLPEVSPYVTKTEIQLRMAGLAYEKVPARPDTSPKGQLPWIEDNGDLIADSHFIREHIEWKYSLDLDAGLSAAERAQAWAIERMVENHFGWTSGYARFMLPENFDKGPGHWFDGAPEEMRPALRQDLEERVMANIRAVGVGRHSAEEIEGLGLKSLQALSDLLGDKPFLMGERETGVDAVTFAMLAGLLTPFFDSPLRRHAERFTNLVAYVDRMMARHYPDFAWRSSEPAQIAA